MLCMSKDILLDIQFITERDSQTIHKFLKNCDRFVFLDYGVSVGLDVIQKLSIDEFPEGYKVLTVPCVTDNVDWEMFKRKTLENSTEPVNQRALTFDIVTEPAHKKHGDKLYDFVSSSNDCRIFSVDTKSVLKKLRDADSQFKSFEHLKKIGVKIGVLRSAPVICHYVYECLGNILDSSGVKAIP